MTDALRDVGNPDGEPLELISESFDALRVTTLRHDVGRCAAAAGLSGTLLDDFVLAVNELVTNAVRHGGGTGALRMWLTPDRLVCEVTDAGPGMTADAGNGNDRPSMDTVGGWGLWLARQLSETMQVTTGPDGTTVQISALRPGNGAAARAGDPGGGATADSSPGKSTSE